MFDPYRKWLGIPEGQRPPTHYQLLGISPDEQDRDVINAAVVRQSAFVRNFQTGKYSQEATRLLNEIAAAKVCLMDAAKRAAYDAQLSPHRPAAPHQSGGLGDSRSSSWTKPAPNEAIHPRAPVPRAPAAPRSVGRSRAMQPSVRRNPQPVEPSPLLSEPADIWSAAGEPLAPVKRPNARASFAGVPHWAWFLPLGSLGLIVLVLIAISFARRPTTNTVSQAYPSSNTNRAGVPSAPVGTGQAASSPATTPSAPQTVPPPKPAIEIGPLIVGGSAADSATKNDSATGVDRDPASSKNKTSPGGASNEGPGNVPAGEPSLFVDGADWSDGSTFSIPAPSSFPIVFARASGPFVAVGSTLFELSKGEAVGDLGPAQLDFNVLRALSADGRYFAAASGATVEVRRCKDGQIVAQLQREKNSARVDFLDFGGPERVITSTRYGGDQYLQVWDLPAGKLAKEFTVDNVDQHTTLNDDGRFLAVVDRSFGIVIYDVQKSPSKGKGKVAARISITPLERRFIDIDGFRFSPNGEEMAAVCDNGARVLCWNKTTQLVFEHALGAELRSFWSGAMTYGGRMVEWHPGGRGWLLGGHSFLDRQRHRVTWLLKSDLDGQARHRFLDEDRLAVCRGSSSSRELCDVKIPWKKIDDSFAAMNDDDTPAWLGPGQAVTIRVKVGSLASGASPQQVDSNVGQVFAQRLAVDGIKVAESQPTIFSVEYSEQYQPPRTISPPAMPGMRFNIPPRQIPGSTNCTMTIRLHTDASSGDLWTTTVTAAVADDAASGPRVAIYAALGLSLRTSLLPYFIPKNKDLVALPAVIRP